MGFSGVGSSLCVPPSGHLPYGSCSQPRLKPEGPLGETVSGLSGFLPVCSLSAWLSKAWGSGSLFHALQFQPAAWPQLWERSPCALPKLGQQCQPHSLIHSLWLSSSFSSIP